MRVEELRTDELKSFIGQAVEQKLEELLGDPDWNLELREDVKQRLRTSLNQTAEAGVSIEDVASRTRLRW